MAGRTAPEPIPPFDMDFTPLRRLRSYRLLTRAQLARAAGVHPITVWRIETNRGDPSGKAIVAIARALGVPMHDLFTVIDAATS